MQSTSQVAATNFHDIGEIAPPNRTYFAAPIVYRAPFYLTSIRLRLGKYPTGNPVQTMECFIFPRTGDTPGNTPDLTSPTTLDCSTIVNGDWYEFFFTPTLVSAGATVSLTPKAAPADPTVNFPVLFTAGSQQQVTNKTGTDATPPIWTTYNGSNPNNPIQYEMYGYGVEPQPTAIYTWEGGANGALVTNTTANAGLIGGTNGAWDITNNASAITHSTAAALPLLKAYSVDGVSYNPGAATKCCSGNYNLGPNVNQDITFNFTQSNVNARMIYAFQPVGLDTSMFYTFGLIGNANSDFANIMFNGGEVYVETFENPNGNPDTGTKWPYVDGDVLYAQILFSAGTIHTLGVHATDGSLLMKMTKAARAAPNNGVPVRFQLQLGDSGATGIIRLGDVAIWYDNEGANTFQDNIA